MFKWAVLAVALLVLSTIPGLYMQDKELIQNLSGGTAFGIFQVIIIYAVYRMLYEPD